MAGGIADYRAQYRAADILVAEVQGFRNEAGTPAVVELRNAGQHFLDALDDTGKIVAPDELVSAINHCRRACYEATEAGILFAVTIIKKFQDDYPTVELSAILPRYVARCREANDALRLIEAGRQKDFDRDQDHQDRIAVFRTVRPFAEEVIIARPEANKRLAEQIRLRRRFITQISLAVAAILISATVAIGLKVFG